MSGLREQKKVLTRRHIADVAARLFGEHGYENVTVADVARTAQVSPQTVYNHFHTKRELLLDREDELRDALVAAIRERAGSGSIVDAVRPVVLAELDLLRARTHAEAAGDLPVLFATSSEIRRLMLESLERQSGAVADAIVATGGTANHVTAKALAWAVLTVMQSIVDLTGRRLVDGEDPRSVADEIEPTVTTALDDLARRF